MNILIENNVERYFHAIPLNTYISPHCAALQLTQHTLVSSFAHTSGPLCISLQKLAAITRRAGTVAWQALDAATATQSASTTRELIARCAHACVSCQIQNLMSVCAAGCQFVARSERATAVLGRAVSVFAHARVACHVGLAVSDGARHQTCVEHACSCTHFRIKAAQAHT